jgi:hypothetical protein
LARRLGGGARGLVAVQDRSGLVAARAAWWRRARPGGGLGSQRPGGGAGSQRLGAAARSRRLGAARGPGGGGAGTAAGRGTATQAQRLRMQRRVRGGWMRGQRKKSCFWL